MKRFFAFLTVCFLASIAIGSTYFGPVNLQNAVTVSQTTWVTVLSQTVPVTNSVYVCQDIGLDLEFCSYDNTGQVVSLIKDANAVNHLKYRFLIDGRAQGAPLVTNNPEGSLTLYLPALPLKNGNHTFAIQLAKKSSGSPSSIIDPATGDFLSMGVTLAKP